MSSPLARDPEHEIQLKVMRLGKPRLAHRVGTAREPGELGHGCPDVQDGRECFALQDGDLLLQSNFGEIFLGETFSCFLSIRLARGEASHVQDIIFKVELSTSSKKYLLHDDSDDSTNYALENADVSRDFVLHRIIRDEGVHLLVCNASYMSSYGVRRNLRKLFKFSASQPFALTQRLFRIPGVNNHGDMYIESELRNATPFTLCLNSLRIVVNSALFRDISEDESTRYLMAGSTLQVLHRVRPVTMDPPPPDGSSLGYIEIGWVRGWGERGIMVSPALAYQSKDARTLNARVELPDSLKVMQPVSLSCVIQNMGQHDVSLVVRLHNEPFAGVLLSGNSGFALPSISPGESASVELTLLPVRMGLQNVGGLVLADSTQGSQLMFNFGTTLVIK